LNSIIIVNKLKGYWINYCLVLVNYYLIKLLINILFINK